VSRYLIVNADDFGFSSGINRGIVECFERGIVTSASLMVDQPGAEEAAAYSRAHPELGVGLHIELPRPPVLRLGSRLGRRAAATASAELRRQLSRFHRLVGRDPTHLDSHRHRHRHEPVRSVVVEAAHELGVPVRHFDPLVKQCPDFYGQSYGRIYSTKPNLDAIGVDFLVNLLETLGPGITELCCHPGYADDLELPFRKEPYRGERALEVRTLCDERVRAAVDRAGIRLRSFSDIAALRGRLSGQEPQRSTRNQST
jgi:predicted glycoside hydrolase/deacetylase ChbG (UPF0249 family)